MGEMTDEAVFEYLANAIRRDWEKGGDGSRTTREAAEYFGVTTSKAAHRLNRLYDRDLIGCTQDGRRLFWRALNPGGDHG